MHSAETLRKKRKLCEQQSDKWKRKIKISSRIKKSVYFTAKSPGVSTDAFKWREQILIMTPLHLAALSARLQSCCRQPKWLQNSEFGKKASNNPDHTKRAYCFWNHHVHHMKTEKVVPAGTKLTRGNWESYMWEGSWDFHSWEDAVSRCQVMV